MRYIQLLFAVILTFSSCKEKIKAPEIDLSEEKVKITNELDQLDWILGKWSNENEESQSYEVWQRTNDSVFSASSITVVEGDTVFVESMVLEQKNGEVTLKATTEGQNKGATVGFRFVGTNDGEFIFENKQHDFPQRIIYTNPVKDSIHAWIVGISEGEFTKVDFYFKRDSN